MQTVYVLYGQWIRYEPTETIGIYDSKDKALEAKEKAEAIETPWESKRYAELWIDEYNLNETIDLDDND